jgi:6-phosphogluconolactonase
MGCTGFRMRRSVVLLCGVAALFGAPQALANGGDNDNDIGGRSSVYVQTNTAPANFVMAFDRNRDGTLDAPVRYATGGVGKPAGNPPLDIPFLDSAGSVTLSQNGKLLFVVNAGNNTVSSFRVNSRGLQLADVESTFGSRPVSSTVDDKLLYVLNSDTATSSISGYDVGSNGSLTPIAGSVRPTFQPAGGLPAQIQFDAKGKFLAVSERAAGVQGTITIFKIGNHGVAGPPVAHPSVRKGPFGIAFTDWNQMIVSNENFPEVALSSVSSYDFSRLGEVTHQETEPANAGGACWNVITRDNKYVFVTSPFTSQINSFRIGRDGSLTPVTPTSVVATETGLTLDEALSHNSKQLYVLVSAGFASATIAAYDVNHDGTITPLGKTAPFEGSASGAAAW